MKHKHQLAERLIDEIRVLRESLKWVTNEKERLERAIQRTLDENGHLADGDNCTLIHLKRALPPHNGVFSGAPTGASG